VTIAEAKADVAKRLKEHTLPYLRLRARTVGFYGFGYGEAIFVDIFFTTPPSAGWKERVFGDVPKPSAGGYIPRSA
jgi:hypothetical protein